MLNDSIVVVLFLLIIGEFDHLFQASANFFLRGPDSKYFRLQATWSLLHLLNSASLWQESIHRQYVSERLWLCFSVYRNRQQPDLAHRQSFAELIYSAVWWVFRILLWIASLYPLQLFYWGHLFLSCWFIGTLYSMWWQSHSISLYLILQIFSPVFHLFTNFAYTVVSSL